MLGIYGGSFDPIHFGHIKTALMLLEHFEFEQIKFVPCQLSPHKPYAHVHARHRWQMLNLVCRSNDKLNVDDRELKRKPPSYTIDTLLELRSEYGKQQSIAIIMGLDAYLSFCAWHRYKEILPLCHIILLQRPGYTLDDKPDADTVCEKNYYDAHSTEDFDDLKNSPCGKIFMSHLEQYDISSTQIRQTIKQGEQPNYLIPGNVWNYIRRNDLYK